MPIMVKNRDKKFDFAPWLSDTLNRLDFNN